MIWYGYVSVFSAEQLWELLDSDDKSRASKFQLSLDRDRFVISNTILRKLLSKYLGIEPTEIHFEHSANGKPSIAGHCEMQFTVAHSKDMMLWAFTKNSPIGIDVEHLNREVDVYSLMEHYCSPNEQAKIKGSPISEQRTSFITCWTRKEAFFKAVGCGLSFAPAQLEVSLLETESPEVLATPWLERDRNNWSLRSFDLPGCYRAAVAINAQKKNIEIVDVNNLMTTFIRRV